MLPSNRLAVSWLLTFACSCTGAIGGASNGGDPTQEVAGDKPTPQPSGPAPAAPGTPTGSSTMPGTLPATPAIDCSAAKVSPARARVWLLDEAQIRKTLATVLSGARSAADNSELLLPTSVTLPDSLLTFEPDGEHIFSTFAATRTISVDDAADIAAAARSVAERLLGDKTVSACIAGTSSLRDCLLPAVLSKAELLFRRPVAATDVAHYLALPATLEATVGRREAARLAFEAMLVSPRFLFRSEVGVLQSGRQRLDAFEIADALSYSLTDGPPDKALWADAASGALADRATIEKHVTRLLTAADKSAPARKLLRELFSYGDVAGVDKVNAKFHQPGDLIRDADLFIENVLRTSAHKDFYKELLAGRNAFARVSTKSNYGELVGSTTTAVPPITGTAPEPVTFTGERQGLLGHPTWLSAFAQPERTDPVTRGRFIYERLLCGQLSPPPPDIIVPDTPLDPKLQQREKLAMTHSTPVCQACHQFMDGVGLSLEGFDYVGRTRSMEAGRPVDRSGYLRGSGDQDGPFKGLDGLTAKLLASQHAATCFTAQTFHFFMGRPAASGDACVLDDSRRRYQQAGGDLTAMVHGFFTSEAFLFRTGGLR